MSSGGYSVAKKSAFAGTVTSVGLSAPSIFSVSGSPVTTAGTIAVTLVTQAKNTVFAGPAAGADATPTFRALTAADIPDLSATYAKLSADNVFTSTGYIQIPSGTTAQQPGSPANGMIRYNSTTGRFEFYNGAWINYVKLSGDTMTGNLTVPTVALTTSVTLLDTTQKTALDVSAANTLRVGNGFTSIVSGAQTINASSITSTVPFLAPIGSNTNVGIGFSSSVNTGFAIVSGNFNVYRAGVSLMSFTTTATFANVAFIPNADNSIALGQDNVSSWSQVSTRIVSSTATLLVKTLDRNSGAASSAVTVRSGTLSTVLSGTTGAVTLTTGAALSNDLNSGDLILSVGAITGGTGVRGSIKLADSAGIKMALWNATPIVQPTTAVASATFVANTSGTLNDTATWDGYTLGQVVKALRNFGMLA